MIELLTRALAIAGIALVVGLVDAMLRPVSVTAEDARATLAAQAMPTPAPKRAPASEAAEESEPDLAAAEPEGAGGDAFAGLGEEITLDEARAVFDSERGHFIDARILAEYEEGHIPGALWLPADQLGSGEKPVSFYTLEFDRPIVIYCGGGDCEASHNVAIRLQLEGFTRVHVFVDGFPAWEAAGLAVESGPDPLREGE